MKLNTITLVAFGLALVGSTSSRIQAADVTEVQQVDEVTVKNGELLAVTKGKSFSPTNTVGMPLEIIVLTNMTFTVNGGAARTLTEGQVLRKDGMLRSPTGSIVPVIDHVAMRGSKVVIVKNGTSMAVQSVTDLGNGGKVLPDGTLYDRQGNKTRLLDGQLFKLSGSAIPAVDTVTLKEGKVIVQKDGALITVKPNQTIMMNNGTKVFSDGRLIYSDGTTKKLSESEIVEITGVRRLRQ